MVIFNRGTQTVDGTPWWQQCSTVLEKKNSPTVSRPSPCRVYCTIPGISKHSPVQCLLFVWPALATAACFTLLRRGDSLGLFYASVPATAETGSIMFSGCTNVLTWYLGNALRGFLPIWYKHLLGLMHEMIRIWGARWNVKVTVTSQDISLLITSETNKK